MEVTEEYSKHAQRAIKEALLTGQWYTAKELNAIGNSGDARKIICRLKDNGMCIDDIWSKGTPTRFKYYRYIPTTNE